jgi:hypothetical protein
LIAILKTAPTEFAWFFLGPQLSTIRALNSHRAANLPYTVNINVTPKWTSSDKLLHAANTVQTSELPLIHKNGVTKVITKRHYAAVLSFSPAVYCEIPHY